MMQSKSYQLIICSLLCQLLLLGCSVSKQGDGVNNGGDPTRNLTVEGKLLAATIVVQFDKKYLDADWEPEVVAWLTKNRAELGSDINNSAHIWQGEEQETCARTSTSRNAAIYFSFPACIGVNSAEQAARLLIHESVHHFGITNEEFADKVQVAALKSWRILTGHSGTGSIPALPSAKIRVSGGHAFVNSLSVNFEIEANESVRYYKVSTARDFLDAEWKGVEKSFSMNFEREGPVTLYYKVTNGVNLESSAFTIKFKIDMFSSNGEGFIPFVELADPTIHFPNRTFQVINIEPPAIAIEMMVSSEPLKETDAPLWVPLASNQTVTIEAETLCGSHPIYLGFRSKEGYTSALGTTQGNIVCPQ